MMDDPDEVAARAAREICALAMFSAAESLVIRTAIERIVKAAILSVVPTPSDGLGK